MAEIVYNLVAYYSERTLTLLIATHPNDMECFGCEIDGVHRFLGFNAVGETPFGNTHS